jgi:hypothetical protein
MSADKLNSLKSYAEALKVRLSQTTPPRHADRAAAYKWMLETDLKKTLRRIEELQK